MSSAGKSKAQSLKVTHVCPLCRISHKACRTIKCGVGEKFLDLGIAKPWLVNCNKELCSLFKEFKGDPCQRKQFKVVIEERMQEVYQVCVILEKQYSDDHDTFTEKYFKVISDFYEDLIEEVKLIEALDMDDSDDDMTMPKLPPIVLKPHSSKTPSSGKVLQSMTPPSENSSPFAKAEQDVVISELVNQSSSSMKNRKKSQALSEDESEEFMMSEITPKPSRYGANSGEQSCVQQQPLQQQRHLISPSSLLHPLERKLHQQ
nr:unnamed protein product [Naegleria fowleri]